MAGKSLGHLQVVPWVSVPRRTVLLWAGRASGNRIRAAAGFPAALLVPRNQIGEPQDAHSLRPGCAEGRVPDAYRVSSAFQAVGAGEIWRLQLRARNRLALAPGGQRGQALFPSAQRGPSLLCHCRAQGQARGLKLPWPSEGEGTSEGTCLRRGPRAPHSAGSAWVESMGNPAGLRCGHTGPAAALGLPRNHTELSLLPWWRRGVCSHRRGSRHPLPPVGCCSSLPWNPSRAPFQPLPPVPFGTPGD